MSARGVKGKKRRKKKLPTEDKAQSARFIQAAKELGADEGEEAFERALRILTSKTKRGKL